MLFTGQLGHKRMGGPIDVHLWVKAQYIQTLESSIDASKSQLTVPWTKSPICNPKIVT